MSSSLEKKPGEPKRFFRQRDDGGGGGGGAEGAGVGVCSSAQRGYNRK